MTTSRWVCEKPFSLRNETMESDFSGFFNNFQGDNFATVSGENWWWESKYSDREMLLFDGSRPEEEEKKKREKRVEIL